jgi:hypothetical protein
MGRVGELPPERIRMAPYPGRATEQDVIQANESKLGRLCELVDGVLVEKAMDYYESRLASVLIWFIETFLNDHDLGFSLALTPWSARDRVKSDYRTSVFMRGRAFQAASCLAVPSSLWCRIWPSKS